MKWSVILADRLGPEILTMLEIKGQVLHLVRVHLKVPGWLSDLKALLTRKLPMFLSRLNEISGGREKMCCVSRSLRRILKFLRITANSGERKAAKGTIHTSINSPARISRGLRKP